MAKTANYFCYIIIRVLEDDVNNSSLAFFFFFFHGNSFVSLYFWSLKNFFKQIQLEGNNINFVQTHNTY